MKCKDCNAVFCLNRTTDAEQDCVFERVNGLTWDASIAMPHIPNVVESLSEYLLSCGWILANGVYVLKSLPRLGWKPDGTMIIGYFEFPAKITTVEEMEMMLKLLKI